MESASKLLTLFLSTKDHLLGRHQGQFSSRSVMVSTLESGCNSRIYYFHDIPRLLVYILKFTLTLRLSAVSSSNSCSSLKLISVFLKVLTVFIVMPPPSVEIMVVGLVMQPIWRVAKPTPRTQTNICMEILRADLQSKCYMSVSLNSEVLKIIHTHTC